MSTHEHQNTLNLDKSRFINTFLKILINEHFQLVPFLDNKSISALPAQVTLEFNHSKISAIYYHTHLNELFSFINTIPAKLLNIDSDIIANWNYLGNTEDKQKYLDYLENTFWTLQSEPTIQKSPILTQMTEKTWLISKVLPTISNIDYKHAPDFFSKDSEEFNLKIDSLFSKLWQPNLDLIINPNGAFQFKIECKKNTITGFIMKIDSGLVLNLDVEVL